jgi:hypothetical protein
MRCAHCGAEVAPEHTFCSQCGTPLTTSGDYPSSASSPSAAGTPSSRTLSVTVPVAFTHASGDYWRLGALALLFLSLFLPIFSSTHVFTLRIISFGLAGWLALLIVLALAVLTAIPTWRPAFWPGLERFLAAAVLGNVVTVLLALLSMQGLITRLMTKLQSSMLGSFVSSSLSSHVPHLGFAPFLALIGSIGWAVIIWRIYPNPAQSAPLS